MSVYIQILQLFMVINIFTNHVGCSGDEVKQVEAILTYKDQIDSSCSFQEQLDLTVFLLDEKSVKTYDLRKKLDCHSKIPVYLRRVDKQDKEHIKLHTFLEKRIYQDINNNALIEVTCQSVNDTSYFLEGVLAIGDKWLTISPNLEGSYDLAITDEQLPILDDDLCHIPTMTVVKKRKKRRGPMLRKKNPQVYIDVATMIDYSVYKSFYEEAAARKEDKVPDALQDIRTYFALVIRLVDFAIQTTIQPDFHVTLTGYIINENDDETWLQEAYGKEADQSLKAVNAKNLLDSIRSWAGQAPNIPPFDHLITYTRYDLYQEQSGSVSPLLGLADTGTFCIEKVSVSVVHYQADSVTDAITTANQLGHSLGSDNDGEGKNPCGDKDDSIMKPIYGNEDRESYSRAIKYSICAKGFMVNFMFALLERGETIKNCLMSKLKVDSDVVTFAGMPSGQIYDVQTQCRMVKGERSQYCQIVDPKDVCRSMNCMDLKRGYCIKMLASEGTSCGSGKMCKNGVCTPVPGAPVFNAQGHKRPQQPQGNGPQHRGQQQHGQNKPGAGARVNNPGQGQGGRKGPGYSLQNRPNAGRNGQQTVGRVDQANAPGQYGEDPMYKEDGSQDGLVSVEQGVNSEGTECTGDFDIFCEGREGQSCCGFEVLCCDTCRYNPCSSSRELPPSLLIITMLFIYSFIFRSFVGVT